MKNTAHLVCMACLALVMAACSSSGQRTGPISPSQADREVRDALGYANSHAMVGQRWIPDLNNSESHRRRFAEKVKDWEAEHFAAIVRYFVTLDPASEKNLKIFQFGAEQCTRLAERLTEEERAHLKAVYRSSGYIEWLERLHERPDFPSPAASSEICHFNVSYLNGVATHGIRFGAVTCEPLMRRIIDRAVNRERGWCHLEDYWLLGVALADPDPLPSPDLVRFFGDSTKTLIDHPLGLDLDLAGRILIAWWVKADDAGTRAAIISAYLALPPEIQSTDTPTRKIELPPASYTLMASMDGGGRDAEWSASQACDFIVAAIREPGRFDKAFIELALRFTKQAKERLLACDLRQEWRRDLEEALAEQRRNMPWLQ